jgi:hypothetical protein
MELINKLPELQEDDNPSSNKTYVKKSLTLVTEALNKGSDVMQMGNGDILITEVKTVTYKYKWNDDKNKFERVTSGSKVRKRAEKEVKNKELLTA